MARLTINLPQERTLDITNISTGTIKIKRLSNQPGDLREADSPLYADVDLAPSSNVRVGPYTEGQRYVIVGPQEAYTYTIGYEPLSHNHQGTGLINGGLLSINADPTKFDISAGKGTIVDNYTDPENPSILHVEWPELTGITPTFLSSAIVSFVGLDTGGNVAQFVGTITEAERRDYIIIGILVHTQGIVVEGVAFFPYPSYDQAHALIDLTDVMGPINKTGNKFSANGSSLELSKNAGELHRIGINWQNSQKVPNTISVPAETTPNFFLSYQDGSGSFKGFERDTEIDPTKYDDGSGTLATITGNKWQVMRIYLAANFDVIVSPGQVTYTSKNNALQAINTETFNKNPVLDDTNLRCFLVVRSNATDLSDTSKAVFVNADKYGQVAAEGAAFNIPNGIATVTSTPKTSTFNVNFNKAYSIDNSSGAVNGNLTEASADKVGQVCECWITDNTATNNVTLTGFNDTDTINGVTGTAGNPPVATFNASTSNYKKVSVTIIDENTYLVDGADSVST